VKMTSSFRTFACHSSYLGLVCQCFPLAVVKTKLKTILDFMIQDQPVTILLFQCLWVLPVDAARGQTEIHANGKRSVLTYSVNHVDKLQPPSAIGIGLRHDS
jgi:hypothetical protein